MRKLVLATALLLMFTGFAAAQPDTGSAPSDAAPSSNPLGDVTLPDLPGQASDTAKNVLSSIGDAFSNGVQGLGDTLAALLGQPDDSSN